NGSRVTPCQGGSVKRSRSRRLAVWRRHRSSGCSSTRFRCSPCRRTPPPHRPSFPCSDSRCRRRQSTRSRRVSRPCSRRSTGSVRPTSRPARRSSAGCRSRRSAPAGRPRRCCSSSPGRGPMLAAMAELKAAYLITGTDGPKVNRAVRRLRDRIGDDATELLSALEAGGEEVVASCNALGLFVSERRLVVVLVGDDLDELAGEVEKLAAWANGEPIGEREVELLVAPRGEIPPFAMTDAWGRRDVAGVLEASERLLARAGGPARDSLPRVVGLLTSHVTRVAECQAFAAEGVSPREAAERLKKNRFYVEKLFEQA